MDKNKSTFSDKAFTPDTFPEFVQTLDTLNIYSTQLAGKDFESKIDISKYEVFTHSLRVFVKYYISNNAFKKGLKGFIFSFSKAMVTFLTSLKLLKLREEI